MRTWSNARGAEVVITHLSSILKVQADGAVGLGFDGDYENGVAILASLGDFNPEIPDLERVEIARRALLDSVRARSLAAADVLTRLRAGESRYLKQPKRLLALVCELSVSWEPALRPIRVGEATIRFLRRRPPSVSMPTGATGDNAHHGRRPSFYTTVRVTVRARCANEAYSVATERLDLIRALWNLRLNHRAWRWGGGKPQPINRIVSGPIFTVHEESGAPAEDSYWWDASYVEPRASERLGQQLPKLRSFEAMARKGLRKSPIASLLKRVLLRYVRALDDSDMRVAFLQLWGALEELTATSERDSHQDTVRRALVLIDDAPFHHLVLNDMRIRRNQMVHDGQDASDAERMVQQLKVYVDRLLLFLLGNPRLIRDSSEYTLFLDVPGDSTALRKRARIYRTAERLVTERERETQNRSVNGRAHQPQIVLG